MKEQKLFCGLFLLVFLPFLPVVAQDTATVSGRVTDEAGKPVEAVHVAVDGHKTATTTDRQGNYTLSIPAGKTITLLYSHISFAPDTHRVEAKAGQRLRADRKLKPATKELPGFELQKEKKKETDVMAEEIDPRPAATLPSVNPGIESFIKVVGIGVSSANELSSQYSVRGGNFDENLVYVNDVEIYRPFLVRSGQQEGLSFVNPDLVQSVLFSAGGFDAKYGDKLSSVLDIRYRRPAAFAGSFSAGMLGGSLHLENASPGYRFTYLIGARYKTTRHVLNSLDTEADYKPSFTDVQSHFTYDISPELETEVLLAYSRNRYNVIPQSRTTEFGTVKQALQLRVFFDGQEIDEFETYFGSLSVNHQPSDAVKLKFIASAFRTFESETFDIQGQYFLDELETDFGKEDFGDVKFNRGIGTWLNHARNRLDATVVSGAHKGSWSAGGHEVRWGIEARHEEVNDVLSEWTMIDSAGFSLPQYPYDKIGLQDVVKADIALRSNRMSGYIQGSWLLDDSTDMRLTAGLRAGYWDVNEQYLAAPRAALSFRPRWTRDFTFRFAAGLYHQPPFYRELRDLHGRLNKNIRAQSSAHFIAGSDYFFRAWQRPFKFVTELYYKRLDNLIPYEVDNVRIRYYAENSARGYAAGIDFKINGEFVEGVESWVNLSVMQTREDIKNDFYYDADSNLVEPGYIPRPADQRVNMGLFFQDYLPKNPTYKVHLNLLFGTGLPFGPPSFERYKDTLRLPPYRRVDIGFSKQLVGEDSKFPEKNPFRHFRSLWVSLEVFNLLQVNNTVSYLWVKDVTNTMYAVPNFLTARQLNLRLTGRF